MSHYNYDRARRCVVGREDGAGGGGAADPLFATAKVWIYADPAYAFTDDDFAVPAADGEGIQGLTNRGTAGNLTQTTEASRPILDLDGGRWGIVGDGTDNWMIMPSVTLATGWSLFVAHATTADSAFFGAAAATRPQIRIGISGTNTLTAVCDEVATDIATSAALATARGQPTVSGYVYDPAGGGTVTFYENGSQVGTPQALTGGYAVGPAVDRFGGLRTTGGVIIPYTGPVYEAVLDDSIFAAARRTAAMAALKATWGTP